MMSKGVDVHSGPEDSGGEETSEPHGFPERYRLRREYMRILQTLREQQQSIWEGESVASLGALETCMDDMERMHENSFSTVDATLDSRALRIASDLCLYRGKQLYDLHRSGRMNGSDMLFHLKETQNRSAQQLSLWTLLARQCDSRTKRADIRADFLLGPIAGSGGTSQTRKRRARQPNGGSIGEAKVPQLISMEDRADMAAKHAQEATTTQVQRIYRVLEQIGPVPLFKFVLHPTRFSKTIENIFHCSFLVHEGQASVEIDEQGTIILGACERPTEADYQSGLGKKQFMFEMTMEDWRCALKIYPVTVPMIPDGDQ